LAQLFDRYLSASVHRVADVPSRRYVGPIYQRPSCRILVQSSFAALAQCVCQHLLINIHIVTWSATLNLVTYLQIVLTHVEPLSSIFHAGSCSAWSHVTGTHSTLLSWYSTTAHWPREWKWYINSCFIHKPTNIVNVSFGNKLSESCVFSGVIVDHRTFRKFMLIMLPLVESDNFERVQVLKKTFEKKFSEMS